MSEPDHSTSSNKRDPTLSRLDIFIDAAFAFAITMLVISVDDIPGSYDELIIALKGIPAFAASFALIMYVWWSHRRWSELTEQHDAVSTVITLLLMFVVLVFVYPLKIMALAFLFYLSRGWLQPPPIDFNATQMIDLFVMYGIGFGVTSLCLLVLFRRTAKKEQSSVARVEARGWAIMAATSAVSTIWALALPPQFAVFAGFAYATLAITMPLNGHFATRSA
ncbi:MAG: TMEM175 family protein [Pseudomonadota bacterium]